MAPKKDGKKDDKKKDADTAEGKLQEEIRQLERSKNDMQVEHTFMVDKYRQVKSENDRLKSDMDLFKSRLNNATEDYADILEHRQEEIKAEEMKLKSLQESVERMEAEIQARAEEIRGLREQNTTQTSRLHDAGEMLQDKGTLEEAVKRQHALIERQAEELKTLKTTLEDKDTALEKAQSQIEELTLKSNSTTELKILFEEPWLVQTSHSRLRGDLPLDRDWNTTSLLGSGKLLVMYGGVSRTNTPAHEAVGREIAVLNLELMTWERPNGARTQQPCYSHTASVVGRTKLLTFGGMRGEAPSADVAVLNTDTMKWVTPQMKGKEMPAPRSGHAAISIRERVFIFGGLLKDGTLMNDLWIFDQDSNQWTQVTCFGPAPSQRRGATISATEDGRRLYIFGGNDGSKCLNDVHFLEIEKLTWNSVQVHVGLQPEPREEHVASIVSKYLLISGGCSGINGRRLSDTQVLDLYSPRWECLTEGSWADNMMWLKQRAAYSTIFGNKLFTLKPDMHEKVWELQILEFALPEDIERLRHSKKRGLDYAEKLELLDDAVCTVNSIELSWRPPTKNAERIERYKLMIATTTGVVKDVYQGKAQTFKITGLKPNTEYIYCVKALYDDGSFLWSASKAFSTKT